RNGVWTHVAGVIDTSAGFMKIYCNGELLASSTTAGPMVANTVPLTIGKSGTSNTFRGLIDEPAVYNRALSQAEIQSIFNAGSAGKPLSVPVAVANVAPRPSMSIPGDFGGMATQVLTYSLFATDPSPVDRAAGFAYGISWGDGKADSIAATANNGGLLGNPGV